MIVLTNSLTFGSILASKSCCSGFLSSFIANRPITKVNVTPYLRHIEQTRKSAEKVAELPLEEVRRISNPISHASVGYKKQRQT